MPELPPNLYVVVLLRHGESIANAHGLRQGQTHLQLTSRGIQAAHHLARLWKQAGWAFDRVITSPLRRAFQTAMVFAHTLGVPYLDVDPLWAERAIGAYALRPSEAVAAESRAQEATRFTPVGGPGGESPWTLYVRARRAWHRLEQYPPGSYLVVTHGGMLNMVFRSLLHHPPRKGFQGLYVRFPNVGYALLCRRGRRGPWFWCGLFTPEDEVPPLFRLVRVWLEQQQGHP